MTKWFWFLKNVGKIMSKFTCKNAIQGVTSVWHIWDFCGQTNPHVSRWAKNIDKILSLLTSNVSGFKQILNLDYFFLNKIKKLNSIIFLPLYLENIYKCY